MRVKVLGVACLLLAFISFNIIANDKNSAASRFEYIDLFSKVLDLIENQYYRKVDTEKLIEGAIRGMLDTLDPHSSYLDADAMKKMTSDTTGKFGGVGVEVTQKDGHFIVVTAIDDTPAYKAGVQAGDKIVEISHEPLIGFSLEEALEKMRGKAGSVLNIGVLRPGEEKIRYFDLKREIIKIKPVKSEIVDGEYLYLRLTQFQSESADYMIRHIKKARRKAKEIKGIIFDLRGNPGGLLEEAVKVSSIFLTEGVVVSTEGRNPKNKEVRYVKKSGFKDTKTPVAVLINGSSASASEIVAGALQDQKRALILGSQSFGKGSVQTVLDLSNNKGIKLTIQQYMTPSGRKIQARGISPDIELPELKADWKSEFEREVFYIREIDLKGHLNATLETPEEKKLRLAREKEARIRRRQKQIKKRQEREKEKKIKEVIVKRPKPKEDFQVIQAISYLRSAEVSKKIQN